MASGAGLQRFDYVIANPMWNQKNYGPELYDGDKLDRFNAGQPPANTADWGWVQHMFAALNARHGDYCRNPVTGVSFVWGLDPTAPQKDEAVRALHATP